MTKPKNSIIFWNVLLLLVLAGIGIWLYELLLILVAIATIYLAIGFVFDEKLPDLATHWWLLLVPLTWIGLLVGGLIWIDQKLRPRQRFKAKLNQFNSWLDSI